MYKPFFHVGVLVADIEAAAANFTERLGIEFEPTRHGMTASGMEMSFRYSMQGPPFLELVQMAGDDIWAPSRGEGLHHIAFADPDVPSWCPLFDNKTETVVAGPDGEIKVIFTRPEVLHGVWVEVLESKMVDATFERLRAAAEQA